MNEINVHDFKQFLELVSDTIDRRYVIESEFFPAYLHRYCCIVNLLPRKILPIIDWYTLAKFLIKNGKVIKITLQNLDYICFYEADLYSGIEKFYNPTSDKE